nr:FHA domain-containing protein [Deltaproteobacteria bacterium]
MEIRLFQESGAAAGRLWRFEVGRVRIGRSPDNDLALDPQQDLDASSRHCEIAWQSDAWVVSDLGSRNGTFLNGARVQQRALQSGMCSCWGVPGRGFGWSSRPWRLPPHRRPAWPHPSVRRSRWRRRLRRRSPRRRRPWRCTRSGRRWSPRCQRAPRLADAPWRS